MLGMPLKVSVLCTIRICAVLHSIIVLPNFKRKNKALKIVRWLCCRAMELYKYLQKLATILKKWLVIYQHVRYMLAEEKAESLLFISPHLLVLPFTAFSRVYQHLPGNLCGCFAGVQKHFPFLSKGLCNWRQPDIQVVDYNTLLP